MLDEPFSSLERGVKESYETIVPGWPANELKQIKYEEFGNYRAALDEYIRVKPRLESIRDECEGELSELGLDVLSDEELSTITETYNLLLETWKRFNSGGRAGMIWDGQNWRTDDEIAKMEEDNWAEIQAEIDREQLTVDENGRLVNEAPSEFTGRPYEADFFDVDSPCIRCKVANCDSCAYCKLNNKANSLHELDLSEIKVSDLRDYSEALAAFEKVSNTFEKICNPTEVVKQYRKDYKKLLVDWEDFYTKDDDDNQFVSSISTSDLLGSVAFNEPTPPISPVIDFRSRVDPKNPNSPLSKIIGNESAVKVLSWILFDALNQPEHVCTQNLAFVGPSSAGKTMISRVFAEVLGLPHVEISPKAVNNAADVIKVIGNSLGKNLVGAWKLPPMVILLDESHAFNDAVIQSLLKATERNDGILSSNGTIIDCKNVCWHFATTDLGKMFDAFITRFERINLRLYTKNEIAQIIQKNNSDWDESICMMVADYCNRIPREALTFAELVKKAYRFNPTTWQDAVVAVAKEKGIDEYGMNSQRLNILRALGQRPMSVNQLCATASCKEEELKKLILPWLLESTPDQAPYVVTGNRHYITKEGLAELDKRGISHKGDDVLCSADRDE
jgi:Holliday junction resolvasome RuvABC ATP-dependent DNA helicase subunit